MRNLLLFGVTLLWMLTIAVAFPPSCRRIGRSGATSTIPVGDSTQQQHRDLWVSTRKTHATTDVRTVLHTSPTPNNDDDSPTGIDPDRIRRRQLVLSMLAAAAATTSSTAGTCNAAETTAAAAAATDERKGTFETPQIIQPPLDDRVYRTFTLPSNGLRVLVCSDPSTNEAAVAMDVHVGATSDPKDVKGLAHFCEHMLFLGTKKVRYICMYGWVDRVLNFIIIPKIWLLGMFRLDRLTHP